MYITKHWNFILNYYYLYNSLLKDFLVIYIFANTLGLLSQCILNKNIIPLQKSIKHKMANDYKTILFITYLYSPPEMY